MVMVMSGLDLEWSRLVAHAFKEHTGDHETRMLLWQQLRQRPEYGEIYAAWKAGGGDRQARRTLAQMIGNMIPAARKKSNGET